METDNFDESELRVEADPFDEISETVETVETSLAILAERVDQLMGCCERLARENRSLREQAAVLEAERDALREKHEQSRARIEAMIVRLKGLGQDS